MKNRKKLLPNNRRNARGVDLVKLYKNRGRIYFVLKNRQDGIILQIDLDELLAEVEAYGATKVILPNRDGSERKYIK